MFQICSQRARAAVVERFIEIGGWQVYQPSQHQKAQQTAKPSLMGDLALMGDLEPMAAAFKRQTTRFSVCPSQSQGNEGGRIADAR